VKEQFGYWNDSARALREARKGLAIWPPENLGRKTDSHLYVAKMLDELAGQGAI